MTNEETTQIAKQVFTNQIIDQLDELLSISKESFIEGAQDLAKSLAQNKTDNTELVKTELYRSTIAIDAAIAAIQTTKELISELLINPEFSIRKALGK